MDRTQPQGQGHVRGRACLPAVPCRLVGGSPGAGSGIQLCVFSVAPGSIHKDDGQGGLAHQIDQGANTGGLFGVLGLGALGVGNCSKALVLDAGRCLSQLRAHTCQDLLKQCCLWAVVPMFFFSHVAEVIFLPGAPESMFPGHGQMGKFLFPSSFFPGAELAQDSGGFAPLCFISRCGD